MFNFAWSELAVIAVVALIAIGPKDMPVAIRTITDLIKKARRMAAEFQGHVDDLMKEANLGEVRDHIEGLRNFDVRGMVERAVDPDGSLRETLTTDPFAAASPVLGTNEVAAHDTPTIARPDDADGPHIATAGDAEPVEPAAPPAFLPPSLAEAALPAPDLAAVPAFIPPAHAAARLSPPA